MSSPSASARRRNRTAVCPLVVAYPNSRKTPRQEADLSTACRSSSSLTRKATPRGIAQCYIITHGGRRSDRLSYLAVVGRRGVEPRCTCLSDRARRPAGSRPADGRGVEPQRSRARPGSSRSRPPGRFTIHEQRAKVPTPTALRQPAAFEAVPGTCPVHSPRRKTEILIPMPFRAPPRFRRGPGTCPVHLPCEEHEGLGPSHPKVYAIAGRCSSRCANAP